MSSYEIIKGKVSSANFTSGRSGHSISMIVVHCEEGNDQGTAAWFADPRAHSSAHYLISFEGRITSEVAESNCAWHAGNGAINNISIGIELEGFYERVRFPKPMMDALIWLCDQLCTKYNITRDRKHIIGHYEVPNPKIPGSFGGLNSHKDPGETFYWSTLMDGLGTKDEVPSVSSLPLIVPLATSDAQLSSESSEPLIAACDVCSGPAIGQFEVPEMGPGPDNDTLHNLCEGCAEHLPVEEQPIA